MNFAPYRTWFACFAVAIVSVSSAAPAAADQPWRVHIGALIGFPSSPAAFRRDSKSGYGATGGVRRRLTERWSLGMEGEWAQFVRGDVEGSDLTGGERRFGRVGVPLRMQAWEHDGMRRSRLDFEVSAGYAHGSRQPISGTKQPPQPATRADGVAWTAAGVFSSVLFESTRCFASLRLSSGVFPDESPAFIGLVIGIDAAPALR